MYDFEILNYYFMPILLFSIFLISSLKISKLFDVNYKFSVFLFIWHIFFCIVYMWFALSFGADSNKYYFRALNDPYVEFNFGTSFIVLFTRFLHNFFGFSYVDQFIIHSFIGYIGLLAFYAALKKAVTNKGKYIKILSIIIVLLPSVSFWTTALGKDAISFMSIGLALWAALNFKNRKYLLYFSIFIMFMVRPHIAAILIIAFIFALIFDKKVSLYSKVFFGSLSVVTTIIIIPIILNYIGLGESEGMSDVDDYVNKRQNSNLDGGSSLDIASMSIPMQMVTYLFRPLPFEAHNFLALLASLDNVILLLLSILGVFSFLKKRKPNVNSNRLFLWIYFYLSLIILATTTANLGIAMRQKWMFIPFMIFLFLSLIGSKNMNFSGREK
ncbi:hypothetical protein [Acinetobacter sp.]|uniref:hypothetical protein n=1 Tax=Acinetobacter sp. TaxID=472 RepID=UPI00258FC268|nr:hypothetical protein [Acinetobacter sp.]